MKGLMLMLIGGFFGGVVKHCINKVYNKNVRFIEQIISSMIVAFVIPALLFMIDKSILNKVFSYQFCKEDIVFTLLCAGISLLANARSPSCF